MGNRRYRHLRRRVKPDRRLLRILFAQGLSSLGTSVSTVALAVMVFDLTGSVLHMGGILAASALPLVVMSFVGGALLDRFDGRRLMVIADLARAVLIMAMPFASSLSVGAIYLVAAAIGMFSAVFNPSQIKVVGEIASPRELVQANSYLSVARDGAELGGYLVGGLLVVAVGYVGTFAIDSLSYAVSAALLLGLPRAVQRDQGLRLWRLIRESPRVLRAIMSSPPLRTNLLLGSLPAMAVMMSLPNAYGLALEVFKKGPRGFAAMEIVTSCGWIIGGILASRLNYKGDRNRYVFWSILAMSACIFAVALSAVFWVSVLLLALAAVANVGVIVGSMTLFQEIEPRPDKGRMIALRAGFGQLSTTIGLVLGGVLGSALGIRPLFALAGTAGALLAVVAYLPYGLSLRRAPEASELEI
jgi:MFS family permease